tara:strand:- start:646 stop:1182 length:537 start_codon:yes stop_codon:yes gene_type:complete
MNNLYSNGIREIQMLIDIPEDTTIGLIFYSKYKEINDKKIFRFVGNCPWDNIYDVYGFEFVNNNSQKSRISFLENKHLIKKENGIIKLPTYLTKTNGEICLHYNYLDNFNWRCYKNNFKKKKLKVELINECNICFLNYNSNNLNKCKRQNCNFLICNNCRKKLISYDKKKCPNCQISY